MVVKRHRDRLIFLVSEYHYKKNDGHQPRYIDIHADNFYEHLPFFNVNELQEKEVDINTQAHEKAPAGEAGLHKRIIAERLLFDDPIANNKDLRTLPLAMVQDAIKYQWQRSLLLSDPIITLHEAKQVALEQSQKFTNGEKITRAASVDAVARIKNLEIAQLLFNDMDVNDKHAHPNNTALVTEEKKEVVDQFYQCLNCVSENELLSLQKRQSVDMTSLILLKRSYQLSDNRKKILEQQEVDDQSY